MNSPNLLVLELYLISVMATWNAGWMIVSLHSLGAAHLVRETTQTSGLEKPQPQGHPENISSSKDCLHMYRKLWLSEILWSICYYRSLNKLTDKRKCVAVWPLAAQISWDCWNFQLAPLNFSLMCLLKLKYYGNFCHIFQIVRSNAHLNPLHVIYNDKLLIIVEILSCHFVEIFQFQRNVTKEGFDLFSLIQ